MPTVLRIRKLLQYAKIQAQTMTKDVLKIYLKQKLLEYGV